MSEEQTPQEFTREQFLERGLNVTEGEVRAVNQNVYELERAFRQQQPGEAGPAFVVDALGEDISAERLAMLTDYARNFLRDQE
jgi:hypothetical protein